MEPITFTAIVAALGAGAVAGIGKVGENVLVDAYKGLKATLKEKFGDQSEVVEAVDRLEQKPDAEGRKAALQAEAETARVDQDPDVKQAAQELLEHVKAQPGGEQRIQSIQNAIGSYQAQIMGDHNTTTIRGNQATER